MAVRTSNGIQFLVVAPLPTARIGIEAALHDGLGAYQGELFGARDRSWQTVLDDIGAGGLTLPMWHPLATDEKLTHGSQVRIRLDGERRFVGRIVSRTPTIADNTTPAVRIELADISEALDDVLVYPEAGLAGANLEQRLFTPASLLFDVSSWTGPSNADTDLGESFRPEEWPATSTRVWGSSQASGPADGGYNWFVDEFELDTAQAVRVSANASDELDLWVASADLLQTRGPGTWTEMHQATIDLPPGTHRLAARVFKKTPGDAWLNYVVQPMGIDNEPDNPIAVSSPANTVCLPYPATPPGFTVGRIVRQLYEEAANRGYVWPFTLPANIDTHDGNDVPWARNIDMAFSLDDTVLDTVLAFCEGDLDGFQTNPATLELELYQDALVDRSIATEGLGVVEFRVAYNMRAGSYSDQRPDVNVLRVRGPDGLIEVGRPPAIAAYGRRERPLRLEQAPSPEFIARTIDNLLDRGASPVVRVAADVVDVGTHQAYADWWPGVVVATSSPWDWTMEARRVRAITITEDDQGNVTATPELSTLAYEHDVLQGRWLARMASGALGGASARASGSSGAGGSGGASTAAGVARSSSPVIGTGNHPGLSAHDALGLATDAAMADVPHAADAADNDIPYRNAAGDGWNYAPAPDGGVAATIHTLIGTASDSGETAYSLTTPVGTQTDDLLVMAFSSANSTPDVDGPMSDGSWTEQLRYDTSTNEWHAVWWKLAAAAEVTGPITLTCTATSSAVGLAVYRGPETLRGAGYVDGIFYTPSIAVPSTPAMHLGIVFTTTDDGPVVMTPNGYSDEDVSVTDPGTNKSRLAIVSATALAPGAAPTIAFSGRSDATYDGGMALIFGQ